MKKCLESEMLKLRAPEPEDLEAMYALENDSAIWAVSGNCAPYSRYQLKRYIETSAHDFLTDHQIRFTIVLKNNAPEETIAGFIDLTDIDVMDSRAQVGIGLLEEFRCKGIGRKALHMLCEYSRSVLKLHQLYAYVPEANKASIGLFSSCSFSAGFLLQDWTRTENGYSNVYLMQKML